MGLIGGFSGGPISQSVEELLKGLRFKKASPEAPTYTIELTEDEVSALVMILSDMSHSRFSHDVNLILEKINKAKIT
jgi:hypothetical protein